MDDVWTLEAYAVRWLDSVRLRAKPRTHQAYESVLRLHVVPGFGPTTPVASITRSHVRAFVLERARAGYAAPSIRVMAKVLSALLMDAAEEGVIAANPAVRLARILPRVPATPRDRAIPADELAALLRVARQQRPRIGAFLVVLARTGLRLGEGLALQWPDVDLVGHVLHVRHTLDWRGTLTLPKGNRTRVVDLSRDAIAVLEELHVDRHPGDVFVFTSSRGRPWSRSHLRRKMRRLCSLAGIAPYGFHALRHAFATALADRGVDAWRIRELCGHHSVAITEQYVAPLGRHRGVVELLDELEVPTEAGEATAVRTGGATPCPA
jgi:integrase